MYRPLARLTTNGVNDLPKQGNLMTDFARLSIAALSIVASALGFSVAPVQRSQEPAKGVKCPAGFDAAFDPAEKVLRCRREVVRWVVTACPDKAFATYRVKPGADACGPTEIPGVGIPPGAQGSRPVECAAQGYRMMTDRTGQRDRCERAEVQFALPTPAN
jgi:hypothetical protein